MDALPKRKTIRIADYDYSTPGAYFITICIANKEKILWADCRGDLRSPAKVPLSEIGVIIDKEILKLDTIYTAVRVEKYCIMPDHIHLILSIVPGADGRPQVAPTISRAMKQFKGSVSKQVGRSICKSPFMSIASATGRTTTRYGNILIITH